MSRFCKNCGTRLEDIQGFCHQCGQPVAASSSVQSTPAVPVTPTPTQAYGQPVTPPPPQAYGQPVTPPPTQAYGQRVTPTPTQAYGQPVTLPLPQAYGQRVTPPPTTQLPPKAKNRTGLVIAAVAGFLVVVILAIVLISSLLNNIDKSKPTDTTRETLTTTDVTADETTETTETTQTTMAALQLIPFPAELMVGQTTEISCNFKAPDIIIPANYRSLDYVVYLQCWTDRGASEALISVEIPGFTQKFEQKIAVSRLETEISIRPPLLPDAINNLNSSKEAQIVISVTDLKHDKIVIQESRPVTLYSRYDMQWVDAAGTPYYENILAWVTPEAEEIRTLLRLSADSANELTDGGLNAIVGYQQVSDWTQDEITYVQVVSMMHALSAKLGVKYLMTPFSSTSVDLQRVATPAQVINSAGGLCAETAVTIASAIQATNMHAVLILLPGHMQVAVETWTGSGQYFLIETTALDAALAGDYDTVVNYTMTAEDWTAYMSSEGMYAIDCDLASQLGIQAID